MNIETEITPNPETLKFKINKSISNTRLEFKNKKEAKQIVFADKIFKIKGVKAVFIGNDFVSVTKQDEITWTVVKPLVLSFLLDFFSTNSAVINDKEGLDKKEKNKTYKDPISNKINNIIDQKVRPAVAQDGGDIIFERFDKGIVYLTLKGACSGCPSSTATLKQGIENLLKHYVSEVKEVQAIN